MPAAKHFREAQPHEKQQFARQAGIYKTQYHNIPKQAYLFRRHTRSSSAYDRSGSSGSSTYSRPSSSGSSYSRPSSSSGSSYSRPSSSSGSSYSRPSSSSLFGRQQVKRIVLRILFGRQQIFGWLPPIQVAVVPGHPADHRADQEDNQSIAPGYTGAITLNFHFFTHDTFFAGFSRRRKVNAIRNSKTY